MTFRPQITPYSVIANGNMASNITSAVTIVQKISMFSYSYSWSGSSPSGSISVQFSNDYAINAQGNVTNAGTWSTITFESGGSAVTSISISGNTGAAFIDILQTGTFAVRTIYTAVSGTGTLQCVINGKVS